MVGQEVESVNISVAAKVAAFLCGFGLIAIAIQKLVTFNILDGRDFFLTLYYLIFGGMAIASEVRWNKILVPFYFLKYCLGKGAFFLFVATIIFDVHYWWFILMSVLFFLTSVFYFIIAIACKDRLVDKSEEVEERAGDHSVEQPVFKPAEISMQQEISAAS
ncbi:unnamed protein product [Blepharisma stoltei]|uniref:COPI associated protein n=1 Tax=Blepharisma stoltei TaxID=1481888 RepID=A0AAU9KDY2_9CILI|nr:unnamed protein product [Blepharisma stoltei]